MQRIGWKNLVLLIVLLATVFDVFFLPWLLIPNLIALGVVFFVIGRPRKQ